MAKAKKISLQLTPYFTIQVFSKVIRLGDIINFDGQKNFTSPVVKECTFYINPIIAKGKDKYNLLNIDDARVRNALSKLSEESTIVAYLTDKTDENFIDQVKFISGWLCPQLSSDVSQIDFLSIIRQSKTYQRYIANAYGIPEKNSTKSDALLLTTKSLLKVLGVNGPSRDTINKYFKESTFTKITKNTSPKMSLDDAISSWNTFAENQHYPNYEQVVSLFAIKNPKYLKRFFDRVQHLEQGSNEYNKFAEDFNVQLMKAQNEQL